MAQIRRVSLYLIVVLIAIASSVALAQNAERGTHIVKSGETLYRISKMYGVTVERLYQLNPEAKNGLNPGQVLQLPTYQDDKEATYHMVQQGETLYAISVQYGVTVDDIMKVNSQIEKETEIVAGMIIKIPPRSEGGTISKPNAGATAPPVSSPSGGMTGLKLIIVPAGETMYNLQKLTGWTETQLLHYNPQLKDGLKAGMSILVPDISIRDNLAIGKSLPLIDLQTVVLALPFASEESSRFKMYYEGFLMALLDLKRSGASFLLQVVDCSDENMASTMQQLNALPRVDMVIGGVSESSVLQLSNLARSKGATYVIPFTSRNYKSSDTSSINIYQVNTPHAALYAVAAKKFVTEYKGAHVYIVNFTDMQNEKEAFLDVLRIELSRAGMSYTDASQVAFSSPDAVRRIAESHKRVVVVPSSASITAANNILHPITTAADSLGISNVTAFGYPEWQTYVQSIGELMKGADATFYTTFHADPMSKDYKDFEGAFRRWYGHGLGSTFPRYGILGYDTGRYFLTQLYRDGSVYGVSRGIQSEFKFESSKGSPNLHSNLGVFFVRYNRQGGTRRF